MADIRTLVTLIGGLIAMLYLLDIYFCRKRNPDEPKYIQPSVPLIGHVLDLARYGQKYHSLICRGQPELVTLPAFNFRIYVTNSRRLMSVVQKNARTVSFRPFARVSADRFCRGSPHFVSLHDESHAYLNDLFRETRDSLVPGKGLDHQNTGTGNSIERFLLKLERDVSDGVLENHALFEWTKHVISVATTDGVYGSQNPFRNPEIEASYWTWGTGFAKMTAGLPSVFLRKEFAALSILSSAYQQYCLSDHSDASDVIRMRISLCERYQVFLEDTAGDLVGFNIALLGNSVPTAFRALYDIISRPELLDSIRSEVQQIVIKTGQPGNKTFELDVVGLRTRCPILLSSYQETQRLRNIHAPIRKILADTVIQSPTTGKKYFLSKGN